MDKRRKRVCSKGHDTAIVGRNKEHRCNACIAARQEWVREYHRTHPEKHRAACLKYQRVHKDRDTSRRLKQKYGITLVDKQAMFDNQLAKCKTCSFVFVSVYSAHVDHCHTTGKVRGLLCSDCNLVAGKAKDSPARLRSIADYLEQAA